MTRRLSVLLTVLVVLAGVASYVAYSNWKEFASTFRRIGSPAATASGVPAVPANPFRRTTSSEYNAREFDWPQWRGPERTGVSKETGLLGDWPSGGPPLAWQADFLGEGYSTPTVAQGRVFVMGNRGESEYVLALSEADGGLVWSTTVGPVRANGGGGNLAGPRSSPSVDGKNVYAIGLNGDLVCLDIGTGRERWRKDFRRDFGGSVGGWGYCESPLIDGDKLICTPGGKQATLLALNKEDGAVIWKAAVPEGDAAHYASMIAIDLPDEHEYVQFLGGGVVGIAADGRFRWRYAHPSCGTANCCTPVFHDGAVFAAADYGNGGGLAKIVMHGGKATADEVYFTKHMKNHHGGVVLFDGHIYGADDAILTCLEWKTGKVKWAERKAGKGSIAAADGRLYFRNEGGPMILVEANPEKYVEHGRFEPAEKSGSNTWPHPVIANGRLYLRDQQYLFCYDVKQ
jgi:outer membrane protein assembly factor BamB